MVAGEHAQATVTIKDETHMPTKTGEPEKLVELEAAVRKTGLWAEVAKLDSHALLEGLKARRWTGELLSAAETLVGKFGHREPRRTVRLKRKTEDED